MSAKVSTAQFYSAIATVTLHTCMQNTLGDLGPINFACQKLNAYPTDMVKWSWQQRTLELDPRLAKKTKADKVANIVFGVGLAKQSEKFIVLYNMQECVYSYVCGYEKLIYRAKRFAQKFVPKILGNSRDFPFKNLHKSFRKYLIEAQLSGHAEWVAQKHSSQTPYAIWIFNCRLANICETDRKRLIALLRSSPEYSIAEITKATSRLHPPRSY